MSSEFKKTKKKEPIPAIGQPVNEPTPAVTIEDMKGAMQIIEVACKRGAIHPGEMPFVGKVYTNIHTFLSHAGVLEQPAPAIEEVNNAETADE